MRTERERAEPDQDRDEADELEGRAYQRIVRLARAIADLADFERIETPHLPEAIR